MGRYIQDVKEHILDMVHAIVHEFHNCSVRLGFVGYRDFTEGGKIFEILNFTNDTQYFVESVGKVKAFAGGDVPEDVLGGIDQALNLNWTANNKVLFHIGIIISVGHEYPTLHLI